LDKVSLKGRQCNGTNAQKRFLRISVRPRC